MSFPQQQTRANNYSYIFYVLESLIIDYNNND